MGFIFIPTHIHAHTRTQEKKIVSIKNHHDHHDHHVEKYPPYI